MVTRRQFYEAFVQITDGLCAVRDAIKAQTAVQEALRALLAAEFDRTATRLKTQAFSQAMNPAGSPATTEGVSMFDTSTLVPLQEGQKVPRGSRAVFQVQPLDDQGRFGTMSGPLAATSDNSPTPVVDASDQANLYVSCDPPSDLTLDSVITLGDPDGSPSASVTIDWDEGIVIDNATGLRLTSYSQPIV